MTADELSFFPAQALPLYDALRQSLLQQLPGTVFQVRRTQISFSCRRMYGCVSLPRRKADREAGALLITFGLPCRVDDPRILQAVEPYPNRWTHHLLVRSADELDRQLMGWLCEACSFAARK